MTDDFRTCGHCGGYYFMTRNSAHNTPGECEGCGKLRCSGCMIYGAKDCYGTRHQVCNDTHEACSAKAITQHGNHECLYCGEQAEVTVKNGVAEYSFTSYCSGPCRDAYHTRRSLDG